MDYPRGFEDGRCAADVISLIQPPGQPWEEPEGSLKTRSKRTGASLGAASSCPGRPHPGASFPQPLSHVTPSI